MAALRVLIVDENALARSVMAGMLRSFGVQSITQAHRPEDARKRLKATAIPFDLIICDFHFSPRGSTVVTGQDLLDELRQSRGLPMRTSFIMVTDEARYHCVADSVEGALDDYLLKPLTSRLFEERLTRVLIRKRALREVFVRIEEECYAEAADQCEILFAQKSPHLLYAARIGTELYLRLKDYASAERMFKAILELKAIPWARLGIAKVELETDGPAVARRTLESLLSENPAYADAYDVLGRAQLEEANLEGALATFLQAVSLTPGNISRLQKAGALALTLGDSAAAKKHLETATSLGIGSRSFDYQSLFLLALANYDEGVPRGWERSKNALQAALEAYPESFRLKTLGLFLNALELLEKSKMADLVGTVKQLCNEVRRPEFDFEMATNLLNVLGRVLEKEVKLDYSPEWAKAVSERFSVSRTSSRLLELAALKSERLREEVLKTANEVNERSRSAMAHVVTKEHTRSLDEMMKLSEQTLNARVFALTRGLAERHRERLDPVAVEQATARLEELTQTFASYGTHARTEVRMRSA
jgi:CheY-like chemotaxis protein